MPTPSRRQDPIAYVADRLTGGLDTKTPPTSLSPSFSPDLDNIVLSRAGVERRGGFTPIVRQVPRMNAVYNRGFRGETRENEATDNLSNILIVPGMAVAGHRPIYNTYNKIGGGFTIDFMFSPENLIGEHVGNAESVGTFMGPAPYTIMTRPILSKGPVKKIGDTGGFIAGSWDATQGNQWGVDTTATRRFGMPFCIYLSNTNASATAPVWRISMAVHVYDTVAAVYRMHIVQTTTEVVEGATYHVVGVVYNDGVTTGTVRLRTGRIVEEEGTTYDTNTITSSTNERLVESDSPLQLFDCPQAWINEGRASGAPTQPYDPGTHVGTATQRPGLNLGGAVAGSWMYASKRFEGLVEDICIWKGDQLVSDVTARDRIHKIRTELHEGQIISHWPMDQEGDQLIKEVTGRDNDFYMVPSGPIFTESSSADAPGAWFFNGVTSCCQALHGTNPNWASLREYAPSGQPGAMLELVQNNLPHGIEVTLWPDAIEPNFEQVLMEIHGCLRLVIHTDGRVRGYCRNNNGGAYDLVNTVTSTTRLKPGFRYQLSLERDNVGQRLRLYVNGNLESTSTVAQDQGGGISRTIGSVQWGLGVSELLTNASDSTLAPFNWTANVSNYDCRSGFIGKIESARIIAGAAETIPLYKNEGESDWKIAQNQLWANDSGNREFIEAEFNPTGEEDSVHSLGGIAKGVFGFPSHVRYGESNDPATEDPKSIRYAIDQVSTRTRYRLGEYTLDGEEGGTFDVVSIEGAVWWILDRWVFNVDDGDENSQGAYMTNVEVRLNGTSPEQNPFKFVHQQLSAVEPQLNVLGVIYKQCIESDFLSEGYLGNMSDRSWRHAHRHYGWQTPRELQPTYRQGIAIPSDDGNPITLLHDWLHEQSGERFLIAGCGRQLYWVRDIWRISSPFLNEPLVRSLWFHGGNGDHVRIVSSDASNQNVRDTGGNVFNVLDIGMWVYPMRLDGKRALIVKKNGAASNGYERINHAVWTDDGVLYIGGSLGDQTSAWRFRSSSSSTPAVALRLREWNHIHLQIGRTPSSTNSVVVHINGLLVPMESIGDTMDSDDPDNQIAGTLFFGGLPTGSNVLQLNETGGLVEETLQSWIGMYSEYVQGTANNANFPDTGDGFVPIQRSSDSGTTEYLFPFNEGEGWGFSNQAANGGSTDGGHSRMQEFVPIASGLEESKGAPYRAVTFRDRVYVTNGRDYPQEIRFTNYSDSAGPFRVSRVGMQAPYALNSALRALDNGGSLGTSKLTVYMSFLDDLGRESDPTLIGEITPTVEDHIVIDNAPRSGDPQVVARRIYVAQGGGNALFHRDWNDNTSREVMFTGLPTSAVGMEVGVRQPAPRAKMVAVAGFSLVFANLPDTPAGGSAYVWSRTDGVTYFLSTSKVIIDAGGQGSAQPGEPLVGLFGHLGYLYASKRSSIWRAELDSTGAFGINDSVGVGGGVSTYDNIVFGLGKRGVNGFDGSNVQYRSSELEKLFRDSFSGGNSIDQSNEAALQTFSAFYEKDSQLWFSVRRENDVYNTIGLVLHLAVGDRQAWTKCTLPKHSYMSLRQREETEQLLIGTSYGMILRYNQDVQIDGHDGGVRNSGSTILESTSDATASTSITGLSIPVTFPASGFDTAGDGFRGAKIHLSWVDAGSTVTAERDILWNEIGDIYWSDPLTVPSGVTIDFIVGYYDSYWTSGWIEPQRFGSFLVARHIDIDCEARSGTLTVRGIVSVASQATQLTFDDTNADSLTMDMTKGWVAEPLGLINNKRGRYFRVKFQRSGIRVPFFIPRWGFRYDESGLRGGRSSS